MNVYVLSKLGYNDLIDKLNITNKNISDKDVFIISINDTSSDEPRLRNNQNVKVLYFDDTDKDIIVPIIGTEKKVKAKAFTREQAEELLDFIENNKTKSNCVVHCSAGISRSGAVATFIVDYFNLDWFKFKNDNPHIHPNNHVLKLLKMVLGEKSKNE